MNRDFKIKCECCNDTLTLHAGPGQVIISIEMDPVPLWQRITFALGFIFKPSKFKDGGSLWVEPKRFRKFLKQLTDVRSKM